MYHWLDTTFTHLTVNTIEKPIFFFLYFILYFALSWATCALHTNLIHEFLRFTTKEIVGISEEWIQSPTKSLTPIQRWVLTTASIALPTRIPPLPAIAKAPQLRFGVPPTPPHRSPFATQSTIHTYPCFVVLTYLPRLSKLVQLIFTEFLLYI